MNRLRSLAVLSAVTWLSACSTLPPRPSFPVVEASFEELQSAMSSGRVSSRQLVEQYLQRIALYDRKLNAALAINPRALEDADRLDAERRAGRVRGPLHGIPIALKDNIHTIDMPTTGGAVAFEGFVPPYEATLTKNLRAAGAVIIAKTGMTELANFIASGMPANYNGLGGYGLNPYDPRRDPREATADGRPAAFTGGSSSGIGTAANLWAASVGTETSGSILSPANQTRLAAIKPTVGRISRHGVIPITADQDTAGPMAKFVADAAALLGALEGSSADPNDAATGVCTAPPRGDYSAHLKRDALKGARIGIPRAFYVDPLTLPGATTARGGQGPTRSRAFAEAIEVLKQQGAVIVDPADLPSVIEPDPAQNALNWGVCAGVNAGKGKDDNCSTVFKYGMKRDFNAWIASLGASAPVKTLTELRAWNNAHGQRNAIKYGQVLLDISDEMDVVADRARYEADRQKDLALSATRGIDAAMKTHRLDALLFPGSSGAAVAAKPGYPTVIVPFAMVPNVAAPPFPEGFDAKPVPFGISFTGMACSEPRLIELAYAFEQATRTRAAPPATP